MRQIGLFCSRTSLWLLALPVYSQVLQEEGLSNPDAHEVANTSGSHLFGSWGGVRARLLERGVKLDAHFTSDNLWNLSSPEAERASSYNRARGTIDIDFGILANLKDLSFHGTAVWQTGANLGSYLGLAANPSSLASRNTFRLDSWWFEQRLFNSHLALRVGQFAGQDSYGHQNFGKSYVFEPIGASLGNLFTTFETYDPPSTSAAEIRLAPVKNFYVKSMVLAGDRSPFSNNHTGLVPQFRGNAVSVSEIGFTPGKKSIAITPADNVDSRKGYSGLYQFGASYNPGKFITPSSQTRESGNYLLYWIASQALWRPNPKESKGIDATAGYDWSPARVNQNNTTFTAGLRFNEPLPLSIHNTIALGYVQTSFSDRFQMLHQPYKKTERGFELNSLLHVLPTVYVQPTIQYYSRAGGLAHRDVVFGFRTKVEL